MNKRALSAIAMASALVASLPGSTAAAPRRKAECPRCPRGWLQGCPGKRYCQRCGWFEAGERERTGVLSGGAK